MNAEEVAIAYFLINILLVVIFYPAIKKVQKKFDKWLEK